MLYIRMYGECRCLFRAGYIFRFVDDNVRLFSIELHWQEVYPYFVSTVGNAHIGVGNDIIIDIHSTVFDMLYSYFPRCELVAGKGARQRDDAYGERSFSLLALVVALSFDDRLGHEFRSFLAFSFC